VSITDGLFVAGRLLGVNQEKARQKKARRCDRASKQEVEAYASRIMLIGNNPFASVSIYSAAQHDSLGPDRVHRTTRRLEGGAGGSAIEAEEKAGKVPAGPLPARTSGVRRSVLGEYRK
jgi:hypothetical protein